MALNALGVEVPQDTDEFAPALDMRELGSSLAGRVIVPVANITERNAVAAELNPTPATPLYVHRADAPPGLRTEWTTDGATWYQLVSYLSGIINVDPTYWTVNYQLRWHRIGNVVHLYGGVTRNASGAPPAGTTITLLGTPPAARSQNGAFRYTGSGGFLLCWIGSGGGVVTFTGNVGGSGSSFSLDGFTYEAAA